jgi:rare lipoprotein A
MRKNHFQKMLVLWVKQSKIVVLLCCALWGTVVFKLLLQGAAAFDLYPHYGKATWYSTAYTATGEWFDVNELTCAMRKKSFGSYYKVCNQDNGRCVIVRHNNWGPAQEYYAQGRIIDLSRKAFEQISDPIVGIIPVVVYPASPP